MRTMTRSSSTSSNGDNRGGGGGGGGSGDEKKKKEIETLVTPMSIRLSKMAPRCDTPLEYNTDPILRKMTKITRRLLGKSIPLSLQHKFRDNGGLRLLADTLVTSIAVPTAAILNPNTATKEFISLSKNCKRLYYGNNDNKHENDNENNNNSKSKSASSNQFIDVFFPPNSKPQASKSKPQASKSKSKAQSNESKEKASQPVARGMIFFVHGGAWGSGQTWFYRLISKPFIELGFAVAIVGYRVYPLCGVPSTTKSDNNDNNRGGGGGGGGVLTQVDDIELAFCKLVDEYPEWCIQNNEDRCFVQEEEKRKQEKLHPHHLPHLGTIVMGHSSGAHISLLWIVERAKRQRQRQQMIDDDAAKRKQHQKQKQKPSSSNNIITSFIGISGVYDINHHFDYESGRGVEEISPLKPICGYNRKSFSKFTPTYILQNELIRNIKEDDEEEEALSLSLCFPKRMLLIHGIEDDIVPFTSTSEAARILRYCLGGSRTSTSTSASSSSNDNNNDDSMHSDIIIDEYYVPKAGHQDTIVDLKMLGGKEHGGPVTTTVVDWLLKPQQQPVGRRGDTSSSSSSSSSSTSASASASASATPTILRRSKL